MEGTKIMAFLALQRILKRPRNKVYSYYSQALNSKAKIKYTSQMSRGYTLIEIFGFSQYYKSQSGKIKFNLSGDSKVMDIGSFIGDSSVFFGIQGATVYSYEPQKAAYELMLENIKLNNFSKSNTFNNPITSDGRSLNLDINENKISDSFNIYSKRSDSPIKSLKFSDELNKEKKWNLVKIDIEGGEWEIIDYLLENKRDIKKINGFVIEIHSPFNRKLLDDFVGFLRKEKFEVEISVKRELGMIWAKKHMET